MVCGSIVKVNDNEAELFRVKGIINGKEGRQIAILEELCGTSNKPNFVYIDKLSIVWEPKVLVDRVEEYDISSLEEVILMDNIRNG